MGENTATAFFEIVSARGGHFRLESGHHSGLWLDLNTLFADQRRIDPFISALAKKLEPHDVSIVCGPLVGGAFLAQVVARELNAEFCFTERVVPADRRGLYPVRYVLPPAFAERVSGKRVAIVDDVMSAGSALRGTFTELLSHRASTVVAAALLVLGNAGAAFFGEHGIPVEAATRDEYEMWLPENCPLCADGVPVEDVTAQHAGSTTP